MESIDLGINNLDTVEINLKPDESSTDLELPGIELLMNGNVKKTNANKIDVGDLNNLEDELNNLSQVDINMDSKPVEEKKSEKSLLSGFTGIFKSDENKNNESNIGSATAESIGNTNTWDGFQKMNDIPIKETVYTTKLSDREIRRKKRMMLKKLDEWNEKGLLKSYSNYTMDSNFDEIEDEYETAIEDKRKKDSVKLQGWWFTTFINTIDYGN